MIGYKDVGLPATTATRLVGLQAEIDRAGDYAEQVAAAKSLWVRKPPAVFRVVRERLAMMTSGNRRCVYCEDSFADEIEHIRPKDLFPGRCFVWTNYVFACGPCNGPKNNRFAVLGVDGQVVDIGRRRGDPITPPAEGPSALVDPRAEDPLDFLWLDFETGIYSPNHDDPDSIVSRRARYTIDLLGLNRRDDLVRGRRSAYLGYRSRVEAYVERRDELDRAGVERIVDALRAERYRGVWERMKRVRSQVAELTALFARAPEALQW